MAKGMTRTLSMLTILVATCETTLRTRQAADNPVDDELTGLLEKWSSGHGWRSTTLKATA